MLSNLVASIGEHIAPQLAEQRFGSFLKLRQDRFDRVKGIMGSFIHRRCSGFGIVYKSRSDTIAFLPSRLYGGGEDVYKRQQIALGFNTNYTVRAPGTCQGTENCGHVYVLVDNSSCNLSNLPYNNLASSSPSFADLSRCVTATGMHTVTVELRHDDGTIVSNLVGTAVTDKVTITAQ